MKPKIDPGQLSMFSTEAFALVAENPSAKRRWEKKPSGPNPTAKQAEATPTLASSEIAETGATTAANVAEATSAAMVQTGEGVKTGEPKKHRKSSSRKCTGDRVRVAGHRSAAVKAGLVCKQLWLDPHQRRGLGELLARLGWVTQSAWAALGAKSPEAEQRHERQVASLIRWLERQDAGNTKTNEGDMSAKPAAKDGSGNEDVVRP